MSRRSYSGFAGLCIVALVVSAPMQQRHGPAIAPPISTPEKQGMDSRMLVNMFDYIEEHSLQIHSLAVLRRDHLVLEAYFHPFQPNYVHRIASSTKSITSALIGIAIDQGLISDVNQPVLSFFEDRDIANLDQLKQSVTLQHLLTMSSGFDWPTFRFLEHIGPEWDASGDLVGFVLDRPVKHRPGTRFNYNSGNAHLLSAVIQKVSGMSAKEFAEEQLFGPVGISGVIWPSDKNGVSWGGGKVMMTTRDMLRFGYLYLNGGAVAGEQVISPAWIRASSSPYMGTFYENDRYGYLWWIHPSGRYRSLGALGQCIYVIPKEEMVVAVTGGLGLPNMERAPDQLVDSYIIPAVKSPESLPEDPDGFALLRSRIESVTHPQAQPIPSTPEIARKISGRTLQLDGKFIGRDALRFGFDGSSARLHFPPGKKALAIGLDGVHQMTEASSLGEPEALVGLKGHWKDDTTFFLHIVFSHGARFDTFWDFDADGVSIRVEEPLGTYRIRGRFQDPATDARHHVSEIPSAATSSAEPACRGESDLIAHHEAGDLGASSILEASSAAP